MSSERTFYCDGPDCERHVTTAERRPRGGFIFVTETGTSALHFCGWDCILRYAGERPPEEVIEAGDPRDE